MNILSEGVWLGREELQRNSLESKQKRYRREEGVGEGGGGWGAYEKALPATNLFSSFSFRNDTNSKRILSLE
jgi:hypothetical protein